MGRFIRYSLCCLALAPPLAAQNEPADYAVKFVCGVRNLGATPTTASIRNAVKPGIYNTAINLYNATRDSVSIRGVVVATDSAPVSGQTYPMPVFMLLSDRALEVDCDDILRAAERRLRRVAFLKGFVRLRTDRMLEVVAVYSAGPQENLSTMDVEPVLPMRSVRPDSL